VSYEIGALCSDCRRIIVPRGGAGGFWHDLFRYRSRLGGEPDYEQRFQMLATDTDKMLRDSPVRIRRLKL